MDIVLFGTTSVASLLCIRFNNAFGSRKRNSDSIERSDSNDELICEVTADSNEVINNGGMLRSDMRKHNLWHRATYTLVVLSSSYSSSNDTNSHNGTNVDRRTKLLNTVPPPPLTDAASTATDTNSSDDHTSGSNSKFQLPNSFDETFVVVQRRTKTKDYCPDKYDPLPGGVVQYGESYLENVTRELYEEMGIVVSSTTTTNTPRQQPKNINTVQRLFTFPYQDNHVKVWGEFYVCYYRTGTMNDLVLQEEEVASVSSMSLTELQSRIQTTPDDFMPDACYAMQLFYQHVHDHRTQRKLLHGYSSSNLDAYMIHPKPRVIFFDCDDCLYFDNWKTAQLLTNKIDEYCIQQHNLPKGKAYELYKHYGTALRGLLAEEYIKHTDDAIDTFLQYVHDIPIHELISPDPKLRELLVSMDPTIPKYIFTASVRDHAQRVLVALGIDDLFVDIIDCKACQLETKHSIQSFRIAMQIAGMIDAETEVTRDITETCVFFDDSIRNIEAAREIGWRSILVGRVGRDCGTSISSSHAEYEIDHIYDIPKIFPDLFN